MGATTVASSRTSMIIRYDETHCQRIPPKNIAKANENSRIVTACSY